MKEIKYLAPLKKLFRNIGLLFKLALKMDRKTTVLFFLTEAAAAFVPLASAYALKIMIDNLQITLPSQSAAVVAIPLIVIGALAAQYLINLANSLVFYTFNQSYLDYILRYKLQNEVTWKFHEKIAQLDIAQFEDPEIQDLITKTRDTMQWRVPDFLRTFSYVTGNILGFGIAFAALLPYGIWIPILITVITIPRLYLQAKYGAIQWSIWGSGAPQARKLWYLNYLLQEPVTVKETRIAQSSAPLLKRFKEIQDYLYGLSKKALDKNLVATIVPAIIETIFIFLVTYQFLPQVLTGVLSVGSFVLIISMLGQLGSRSADASSHFASIYETNLYVNHFFDFLALQPNIKSPEHPVSLGEISSPRIEFRDVSFSYPGGAKVLDHVSFVIEPGESIALVGHNGAGKTTIVKLLCRFYDVTSGAVLINGTDIRQLDLNQWYKFLGTLFQEFVRYHFTVRENICMSAWEKKDDQAMIRAAQRSGADEFIDKLPDKYDTILGKEFEDGIEISGGQWQKLAIARAFYEEPPVLILDEPTSSIDAEGEYHIFNNLEKQYQNKTLLLVSHRFSTVRNAHKIIVLINGHVAESGNHEELIKLGGEYAKLFTLQAKGYK